MRRLALTSSVVLAALAGAAGVAGAQTTPTFGCPADGKWTLSPAIPSDVARRDQPTMDCFAWQEFIALNWQADPASCAADTSVPASAFGDPDATGPVVWETYKAPADIFLEGAVAPAPWCSAEDRYGTGEPKQLSHLSKFAANPEVLEDIHEASSAESWLTAQSRMLTLYEVRVNRDEFDFIVDNELYNAEQQALLATSKTGLYLPTGSGATTGAIEIKAAWLEIDPVQKSRFLTTEAIVKYPGQEPASALVGLVGLHIIHKTASARQFVWATFEHVDNAPGPGEKTAGRSYTYFNPSCDPATDHYKCAVNQTPNPADDPYDAPMQVRRVNPLGSPGDPIPALNEQVQKAIRQATGGKSVFANYELVDVLWPAQNPAVTGPQKIPVPTGSMLPVAPVANTTLETYVQTTTCVSCHSSAPAAGAANFGSDFSFLLSHAQNPVSGGGVAGWLIAAAAGAAGAAAAGAAAMRRRRGKRADVPG